MADQLEADRARLKHLADIQDLRTRYRELVKIMEDRQRFEAIRYFRPHPKQDAFFQSKARWRAVFGGNRSGKTQVGCSEDYAHSKGIRPWYPKDHPAYKVGIKTPNRGLIIGETFNEQVKNILVPKLLGDYGQGTKGIIPQGEIHATKKNQQGVITQITLTNKSTINFMSYDQEPDYFEGLQYDWIHYDEPPPRYVWVGTQRGAVDSGARSWLTCTPLKEPWIYDELVSRDDVEKFVFDIQDNVGFGLLQEHVDAFASLLNDDEKEARLRGHFLHLQGLVYKEYDSKIHRIKRFPIPAHWMMWFHVDTHPKTPHHAVWIAVDPYQRKFICGALKNSDPRNLVRPMGEAIYVYEKTVLNRRSDDIVRLIEPGAFTNNPVDGLSIADQFSDMKLVCKPGSKNRDAAILLFKEALGYEHDSDGRLIRPPQVFVFDDLDGIHYELGHYIWDEWTGKSGERKTEKNVPRDKDDHFIEGIHRIFLDGIAWEAPPHWEELESSVVVPRTGRGFQTGY